MNSDTSIGPVRGRVAVLVAFALTALAPAAQAQGVQLKSDAVELRITGRLQVQYNQTSVPDQIYSTFFVRRARITAEVKINDFIEGKIQPEYGEGTVSLRDAYVDFIFSPAFRFRAGQFKRPFDRFELVSSTQILVIERTGGVRGVADCAGVDNVCSYSRFTEELNFSDRDIGFEVGGRISRFVWSAAMTNGRGPNNKVDQNGTKSYTGRLEYRHSDLVIGANIGVHDYPNDSTLTDEYAMAFGGDVDWGAYEQPGPHLKAGVTYGENWRNLRTAEPSKFLTTQAIGTYLIPVEARHLFGLEPLLRVSWGDPDTDVSGDDGWLITPGFVFHVYGRNKIAINVDVWAPATGPTEYSTKVQAYLYF